MKRFLPILASGLTALLLVVGSATATPVQQSTAMTWDFDGSPSTPTSFHPAGWDISLITHNDQTFDGMYAEHGPNCEHPDDTWPLATAPSLTTNHFIHTDAEAVYQCSDHLMTAINAGYAAVYMTPPAYLDFSNGPATLLWDMSTQHTSSRDWVDFLLLPMEPANSALQPPMALNLGDFHTPQDAIWIEMTNAHGFLPRRLTPNLSMTGCGNGSYVRNTANILDCRMSFDTQHGIPYFLNLDSLGVSAARRDHFKIEITTTHIKMGMRAEGSSTWHYWVDTNIVGGALPFNRAIVQMNHRGYNPLKPCADALGTNGHAGEPGAQDGWEGGTVQTPPPPHTIGCRAGTWHWDNVSIDPAQPFDIIYGARKIVDGSVTFPQAATLNTYLKASGSRGATYSLDGTTYQTIPVVGPLGGPENGDSFWVGVPPGQQTIWFHGTVWDSYLYVVPTGTNMPGLTVTPTPTATPMAAGPVDTATPVAAEPTSTPSSLPQNCVLSIAADGVITGQCAV